MSTVESYLRLIEACDLIDNRYSRARRLGDTGGAGFFSLMFTAYDNQLRREVALKVRRPDLDNAYRLRCFEREAEVLRRFEGQPDIIGWTAPLSRFTVTLSKGDIDVPFEFSYFPMELAADNLGSVIAQDKWRPMRRLLAFRAMCRAVQRIHSQNTVHRDIKPDNFLVMRSGHIRLSDFGTARSIDERDAVLDQYSFSPGDKRYTSPELIACLHDVDPAFAFGGDIYALGAVLFELFAGTSLFAHVFDYRFFNELAAMLSAAPGSRRKEYYDAFVRQMAGSRPLPTVTAFDADVPKCLQRRIDTLYRAMADLDYRRRLCTFERIFRQINACILALSREYRVADQTRRKQLTRAKLSVKKGGAE